ncbi:MAG: hypothetical protein ABSA65_20290 [Acidimicrobiales bacterium]
MSALHAALPGLLTGCFQLGVAPRGKAVGAHLDEHVIGRAELDSPLAPTTLASQSLSVEQMAPCQLGVSGGPLQDADRPVTQGLGGILGQAALGNGQADRARTPPPRRPSALPGGGLRAWWVLATNAKPVLA